VNRSCPRVLVLFVRFAGLAGCACLAGCAVTQTSAPAVHSMNASATPAASPTPSTQSRPGAAAGLTACAASQLTVTVTHTGALGGQAGGYLKFTDSGSGSCRMTGWPVVTAVTAAGQSTPLRHAKSTMFGAWQYATPLPVLTLHPGGSAYAVIAADDQPAGTASACPAPFVRLRVSPPGSTAGVTVSAWLPGAASYLPSCPAIDGNPTAETSAITPLSDLPH
jgi:hypothetical protein